MCSKLYNLKKYLILYSYEIENLRSDRRRWGLPRCPGGMTWPARALRPPPDAAGTCDVYSVDGPGVRHIEGGSVVLRVDSGVRQAGRDQGWLGFDRVSHRPKL